MVSLAERSASGYDLARRFDKSIGYFWNASHQQIYKVLTRMERNAWVASQLIKQSGRPDKRNYSVTTAGHEELRRWIGEPTPPETLRSEFALKLRGMRFGDPAAALVTIRARREQHQAQLDFYLADAAKNFPDPDQIPVELVGPYLVLRGGIRTEQGGLDWCDEMLAYLSCLEEGNDQ